MHHPVLQRYLAKSLAANPNTSTVALPLTVARRLIASLKREHAGKSNVADAVVAKPAAKSKVSIKVKQAEAVPYKAAAPKVAKSKVTAATVATAKEDKKSAKVRKAPTAPVIEVKKQAGSKVKAKQSVKSAKKAVPPKVKNKAVTVKPVAKKAVKRGMNSQRKLYTIPGYAALSDRSRNELLRHYLENVRDMRVALLNKGGLQQFNGIGPVLEKEIKAWFAGAEVAARG